MKALNEVPEPGKRFLPPTRPLFVNILKITISGQRKTLNFVTNKDVMSIPFATYWTKQLFL